MQKDTPSINKPRFIMTQLKLSTQDVENRINALKNYRSSWENDIREGWSCGMDDAKEILYELYEISGNIILALENVLAGHYRGKMAMIMTHNKLNKLVKSEPFDNFATLGELGACNVITTGTIHHIRVMSECLEFLTK